MKDEIAAHEKTYSLKELCRAANVTERTVRYYKEEGLLPPSEGAGPFARYSHDFLLRLLLIRRLKAEYLPLSEIKRRLDNLSPVQLEDLLANQETELTSVFGRSDEADAYDEEEADARHYLDRLLSSPAKPAAPGQWPTPPAASSTGHSPPTRAREQYILPKKSGADDWKRLRLSPGIEIHFQPDPALSPTERERLAELLDEARRIFRLPE